MLSDKLLLLLVGIIPLVTELELVAAFGLSIMPMPLVPFNLVNWFAGTAAFACTGSVTAPEVELV